MIKKDVEFTEKDFYCLARLLQTHVFFPNDKNNSEDGYEIFSPCQMCKYNETCFKNTFGYMTEIREKLSDKTGLHLGRLLYEPCETNFIVDNEGHPLPAEELPPSYPQGRQEFLMEKRKTPADRTPKP